MVTIGEKVVVKAGKFTGCKGVVTYLEGEHVVVDVNTSRGIVEGVHLYQSSVTPLKEPNPKSKS